MTKYLSFFTLILFVVFTSCERDNNGSLNDDNGQNYNPTEFAQNFGKAVNRTFLGTVIDKNHNPIPDVTITIGNTMAQTDANGVFIISDAPVYERFGYIKAEKTGYITGSRSVVPSEGTNKVEIMLLDETVVATVNSGSVETVLLSNGASVELPGNYSTEDGTAYTGSVNVILHHLDPTDDDMQLQMPGMLYAANSENQERLLQTFGMLAVELKGSGGEVLNLAEGSTAEITVPLDTSLLSNATSTIPLWHFDEEHGYWVEDGEAALVGNAYVGTVSHFSFWITSSFFPVVNICINAFDELGNSLSGYYITLSHNNSSYPYPSAYSYTNATGQACGLIPQNEALELNVFNHYTCGSISIYNSTIGPFIVDSSVDLIIPNNSLYTFETINGIFNDCSGSPITNGYAFLHYGSYPYIDAVTDGNFNFNLTRCSNDLTFSVEGIDLVNEQTTGVINYTFNSPNTNLSTLTSCNNIEEFITYQVDDHPVVTYNALLVNYETSSYALNIQGSEDSNIVDLAVFNLSIQSQNIGTYNSLSDTIAFYILDDNLDQSNPNLPMDITVNLSALGNTGEYIDMNFSGTFTDINGNPHTINGIIHVIRDF